MASLDKSSKIAALTLCSWADEHYQIHEHLLAL